MKTIIFMNEKGGPGKTTLSTYFAAGLAIRNPNHRVLMLDADQQGNTTQMLGLPLAGKFYDLCVRNAAWRDVIEPIHPEMYAPKADGSYGKLYAVQGNSETVNIPNQLQDAKQLASKFAEIKNVFTHVIIDTNPTPTMLHRILATISDWLVIPTEPEIFSAHSGIPQTLERTEDLRDQGRAKLLAIIPNKFRGRTALHKGFLDDLRSKYGDKVITAIPLAVALAESQVERQFLYSMAPQFKITSKMYRMVDELCERMGEVSYEQN